MDIESADHLDIFFWALFMAAQVIGFLSVLLVFYWCISFAGGIAFSGHRLFLWHPIFTTIGMIYLLGNSILMFRIFRNKPKKTLKRVHAAASAVGLVLTVVAVLVALLRPHSPGKAYFYSLHGWLGFLAVILYATQALVSVAAFLLDAVSNQVKACLMPVHLYLGQAIFILGIGASVSGVDEMAFFKLKTNYSKLGNEAVLLNSIGILFVIFGFIVVYLSTNTRYKGSSQLQHSQEP